MKNNTERRNMIKQQVEAWGVLDAETLSAMDALSREDFVPEGYQDFAYADTRIPLGSDEWMLSPKEAGRIVQALEILPTETVLEIGTGSGYLTALLAKEANHVYSIDISEAMTAFAKENLAHYPFDNITLETGDAASGWQEYAPYDVIVVTASLPTLPRAFGKQLNIDGRIFAILGDAPAMTATLMTKTAKDQWQQAPLYETDMPRLQNIKDIEEFTF
jgi:protein-L-isoaspartate(D-aspartate) O-methyltransferase